MSEWVFKRDTAFRKLLFTSAYLQKDKIDPH